MLLCLDAAQCEDDPDSWLTLAKLKDVIATNQVASPGLVEAIVQRMLDRGLLSAEPAPTDRRKRILRVTEPLLRHDLELIEAQARPCALIMPSAALDLALAHDRRFQRAVRLASVGMFQDAMGMLAEHPEIVGGFALRDSGQLVLLCLLESALASTDGHMSTASYQAIADRLGISRTHVREMVADAEAAGPVRMLVQGGGSVEIMPRLWPLHDRFLAACMELFDRCCTAGLEMMSR